jgi:hemerythrin-like domain-containing protein
MTSDAHVLVVAHQTAATDRLLETVRKRSTRRPATFHLVVPQHARGMHKLVDPQDAGVDEAQQVLDEALPRLSEAAGSEVLGSIGDAEPLMAIHDAVNLGEYDEIIISTLPLGVSRWLKLDLVSKTRDLGLPVTHVQAVNGDVVSRRQLLNRRTLIGAGAGVVLGAGAMQTANSLAATPPPANPSLPSPGEVLMTEHGVLKRLLLVYETAADQLAAGQTPPAAAITEAADIVTNYIEGFHEGLEEAYVFPRVQATHPKIVHTLLVQHDRGRHLTAAITSLSTQGLKEAKARKSLHRYLNMFVNMYARHEAWEDTIVFPAIRAVSTPETVEQLAARFAELESAQYGDSGLSQVLGRVSGIEQQLHIGALAAFTPPEVNPPYG